MRVKHTRDMIVFFIFNLEYSRIDVLIVELRNDEKKTLYMFARIMSTMFFCTFVRFSVSITNYSRLACYLQFELLRTLQYDRIIF